MRERADGSMIDLIMGSLRQNAALSNLTNDFKITLLIIEFN
jgi:hypothetical protein